MPHSWHILGAGAIGSLFAAALRDCGSKVAIIPRPTSLHSPNMTLSISRNQHIYSYDVPLSSPQNSQPIENLLVTTKAYDAHSAITAVAHRLNRDSKVVLLVNGMGVAEDILQDLPELQLYLATTTEGAFRTADNTVVHAGTGLTQIGRRPPADLPAWQHDLSQLSLSTLWSEHIDAALWEKLAINCAINPLTAVSGCLNGELINNEHLRKQLHAICREIALVCDTAGHAQLALALREKVHAVARSTAQNRSSMLQDVLAKRPTEIRYISGYLLQTARQHGIDCPLNQQLMERLDTHD